MIIIFGLKFNVVTYYFKYLLRLNIRLVWIILALTSCNQYVTDKPEGISAKDSINLMKQITELTNDVSSINSHYDSVQKRLQTAMNIAVTNKFIYGQLTCIESQLSNNAKFEVGDSIKNRNYKTIDSVYEESLKNSEWAKYRYYTSFLLGKKFYVIRKFDSASTYLSESLKLNQVDSTIIYMTFEQLGIINSSLRNNEIAMKYMKKIYERDVRIKDTSAVILDLINMAATYQNAYDDVHAIQNLRKALEYIYSDSSKYSEYHIICLYNLGQYFSDINNQYTAPKDSAIYYFEKCVHLFAKDSTRYPSRYLRAKLLLANEYSYASKFPQALKYYEQVAKVIKDNPDTNDINFSIDYWEAMATYNQVKGDWENALKCAYKQQDCMSQKREKEVSIELQELEKELKKLGAEKTIAEKEREINRQKQFNTLWGSLAIILCISSVGIYRNFKQKQKLEKTNHEKKILNSKIEERDRIAQEMHDTLGSTVTSMQMATELFCMNPSDPVNKTRINEISEELQVQMNEVIWRMNTGNDYLQNLSAYIYKFSKKFMAQAGLQLNIKTEIPEKLVPMSGTARHLLYLCTKEILNNIVKHAQAKSVTMHIVYEHEILTINIKDDGKGFDMETQKNKHLGNGLKNIEKNINNIGGKVAWTILSGTAVKITLPLNFIPND